MTHRFPSLSLVVWLATHCQLSLAVRLHSAPSTGGTGETKTVPPKPQIPAGGSSISQSRKPPADVPTTQKYINWLLYRTGTEVDAAKHELGDEHHKLETAWACIKSSNNVMQGQLPKLRRTVYEFLASENMRSDFRVEVFEGVLSSMLSENGESFTGAETWGLRAHLDETRKAVVADEEEQRVAGISVPDAKLMLLDEAIDDLAHLADIAAAGGAAGSEGKEVAKFVEDGHDEGGAGACDRVEIKMLDGCSLSVRAGTTVAQALEKQGVNGHIFLRNEASSDDIDCEPLRRDAVIRADGHYFLLPRESAPWEKAREKLFIALDNQSGPSGCYPPRGYGLRMTALQRRLRDSVQETAQHSLDKKVLHHLCHLSTAFQVYDKCPYAQEGGATKRARALELIEEVGLFFDSIEKTTAIAQGEGEKGWLVKDGREENGVHANGGVYAKLRELSHLQGWF